MEFDPISRPINGLFLLNSPIIPQRPQRPFPAVVFATRVVFTSSTRSLTLSIQRSRRSFLNLQRFPNLKAGILRSLRYLYNVSGETPRYLEASRNVITSLCCPIFSLYLLMDTLLYTLFCRS